MERTFIAIKDITRVKIVELLNKIFGDYVLRYSWDISNLERDIRENNICVDDSFVMRINGVDAGIVLMSIKDDRCRIDIMGVLKEYRGSGIGFQMMDKILEICKWRGVKSIVLEVPITDEKAIRFYNRYGFREKRNLESLCLRVTGISKNMYRFVGSDSKTIKNLAYECLGSQKRKPNWQREPGNLSQLQYYNFDMVEDQSGRSIGYCVWGEREEVMYIMDFSPTGKYSIAELIEAIVDFARERYDYILIPAVPEDDSIFQEMEKKGFEKIISQKEMIYRIH